MLFEAEPAEGDHRYYGNLRKPEFRPDITEWCEATYARAQAMLDDDFPERFRRETPHRISELLFAAAFLDAGWEPIDRVVGFDLAFAMEGGRLLVEVTTPDPHSPETWTEKKGEGYTSWSTDAKTEDAALRRLTAGFAAKAERVAQLRAAGEVTDADYVVIAISGLRLRQETPVAPDIGGPMPDFAKAFLPIGSQYVTIQVGEGADQDKPLEGGWHPKATIDQEGKAPVDRDAFLQPRFQHVHAVAYTPLHFGAPISPIKECAALHNPMARPKAEAVRLRLGCEFGVEVREDEFSIGPL
jgi:hypothetical protein